jgi:hypothetical protein
MAHYRVLYWRDIPSQVKAWDEDGNESKELLPKRFQVAIDARAMEVHATDAESYLAGWRWGPEEEREGSAKEVVRSLAAELDAAFPPERLRDGG